MEAVAPTAPPAAAESEAAMALVLGDDDLLREILLRLGFPTCLVRAAAVSKRWLRHASDPAFLRRFRARNPPRLLGFYVGHSGVVNHRFVALPQPPELAVPVSSCFEDFAGSSPVVMDCRNGRLVIRFWDGTPSNPAEQALLTFLLEDGGGVGVTFVVLSHTGRRVSAEVYVLQPDGWGVPTTGVMELPDPEVLHSDWLSPVHGNIYLAAPATSGYILGLSLSDARFFILELPDGVRSNFNLSTAEGSGLYLVHANRFQLSVWHHRMDGDPAQGWVLADTFCVLEECKHLAHQSWAPADSAQTGRVSMVAVGDNAEFVFLDIAETGAVVHVHLKSKTVEKVYERMPGDQQPARIIPLMMVCPLSSLH
ncbi:hypothetical protein ACP70R_019435 [Stipagrostis hirtigluma subsp. patula]